jgi:glycosyltransferase involved in cell wall biosynthesis
MIDPLISVVIPVYNSELTLARCLDSIIQQSYQFIEIIVIDSQSSDNSVSIIESKQAHIAYWESKPDRGIHHAWNKALEHVKGEWIHFLGADDYLWEFNTYEKIAKYLKTINHTSKIAYGKVFKVLPNNECLAIEGKPWEQLRQRFFQVMCLEHQGIFHHQTFFKEYGNFNEDYLFAGDYEILLRYFRENSPVFINEIIACKQFSGVTANPQNSLQIIKEQRKARREANLSYTSIPLMMRYLKAKARSLITPVIGSYKTQCMVNIYRQITGQKKIPYL